MAQPKVRDLNTTLWRLVGVAAVCWLVLLGWYFASGQAGRTARATYGPPATNGVLNPDLAAAAERLNDPLVWYAMVPVVTPYGLIDGGPGLNADVAEACAQRALALAPNDPVLAVNEAARASAGPPAAFLRAARRATELDPDNAATWYVLAAAQAANKDRAGVIEAFARGNRAPRIDDGQAALFAAVMRLAQEAGWPILQSYTVAIGAGGSFGLQRHLRDAYRLAIPANLDERAELLAASARARGSARMLIDALVAQATYMLVVSDQTEHPAGERPPLDPAKLTAELRASGRTAQADYADLEMRRATPFLALRKDGESAGTALIQRANIPAYAALRAMSFWLSLVMLPLVAAFWLLLLAGLQRLATLRQPRPCAWSAHTLWISWATTVLPFVALAMWQMGRAANTMLAGATPVGYNLEVASLGLTIWPPVATLLWIWLGRAGRGAPGAEAQSTRPGPRGLLMPTAALLLVLATAAGVGALASSRHHAARLLASNGDEMAVIRAEMDAFGELPPVSWPAPASAPPAAEAR